MDSKSKKLKKHNNRKKGKYTIHSNHERLPPPKPMMRFISIDPGILNLAIRIERRGPTGIKALAFQKYVITCDRKGCGTGSKSLLGDSIRAVLDSYQEYYPNIDVVCIEDQMYVNEDMCVLREAIINYFYYCYPHICVATISARLKSTLILGGAEYSRSRFQKEEIAVALALCEAREDTMSINVLQQYSLSTEAHDKIHDLCVTINQLEAFCRLMAYPAISK